MKTTMNHRMRVGLISAVLAVNLATVSSGSGAPSIAFTSVPPYGSSSDLSGQVSDVSIPSCRVAVYIYSGGWWTKPTFAAPLTVPRPDGSWTCDITTGGGDAYASKIAAFLIPNAYTPPQASGLPELPASIYKHALASRIVTRPFSHRLHFSGYDWSIKDSGGSPQGPGPNYFSDSPSNVWVDAEGRLHLKIVKRDGVWTCAEVVSVRSFGYGTYRIALDSPADAIDPNAILGLFTWNDDSPYAHREIDIELARWGEAGDSNNGQFVIQPYELPGHLQRMRVPADSPQATCCFTWTSNQVAFTNYPGPYARPAAGNTVQTNWTFAGPGVPAAGGENFRMNLWLNAGVEPTDHADEEVIIRRFVFEPLTGPEPVRINCGGGNVQTWRKDQGCDAGTPSRSGAAIARVRYAPLAVYQSGRTGPRLGYTFPGIPNGAYRVRLHFAEPGAVSAGARTFRVKIEGITVEPALDVILRAGGPGRALRLTYAVDVTDNNGLQIQCIGLHGADALINGIEILTSP